MKDFLQKNNILPELEPFENYQVSYRYAVIRAYQSPPNNHAISIFLNRYIDGHKVSGNGGYCRLTFGENGTIIGCIREWRPYTPYKEYSLHSKSEIIEELQKKGACILNRSIGKINNAIITNVSIRYYQDCDDLSKPYYLQPLFFVEGIAIGEFGTYTFGEYVEALNY